jgi:class 3 adenylate cyclase
MSTPEDQTSVTLQDWAGAEHLGLTLLFTDIVESTAIGIRLGDNSWIEDLFAHFSRARFYAAWYDYFVVKVIGDSLMMAFRTSSDAVRFAIDFANDTGVEYISIRVGIHSGEVQIRDNDVYGLNVNLTSRVQHILPQEGIVVTERVKRDYQRRLGLDSNGRFRERNFELKSFGKETVYLVRSTNSMNVIRIQRAAREKLLQSNKISSSSIPQRGL